MQNKLSFLQLNHNKTKRNYLERMQNKKVHCMKVAKNYEKDYWDGDRKYGYGGYKFIPGRWSGVAQNLIRRYKLNNNSKILDVGCGKGYLLYEIKKILPLISIKGFDISKYAIDNAPEVLKKDLFVADIKKRIKFKKNFFDLVISIGCFHNLEIFDLKNSLSEINRVGKKKFILVESYRNNKELFNLQCWALTCESFFSKNEWIWIFKKFGYNGDFEFIYFE